MSDEEIREIFLYKEWSDYMKALKILLGVLVLIPVLLLCCLSALIRSFVSL